MKCISLWNSLVALETKYIVEQVNAVGNPNHTGLMPLTAPELAEKRVKALRSVFQNKWGIDSHNAHWNINSHIKTILEKDGMELLSMIPPIWRYRLTTSTCQYRHENIMWYFDAKYLPWDLYFNYDDISDGWIHALDSREMLREAQMGESITMDEYLNSPGGGMCLSKLEQHKIFRAIIPNTRLRREYLTCLRILDHFSISDRGKHSLWRPGEIKSGYLRWIALGLKWEAIYPPNATTTGHRLVCHKWPNFLDLLLWAGLTPITVRLSNSAKS